MMVIRLFIFLSLKHVSPRHFSCLGIEHITCIPHNNFTGRWLTPFKAVWHPQREDVILVGSMEQPRRVCDIVYQLFDQGFKLTFFNRLKFSVPQAANSCTTLKGNGCHPFAPSTPFIHQFLFSLVVIAVGGFTFSALEGTGI